ncbi:VOC family protein [Kiloniella majae]|uniref:VOC family protein n=1 Tax=Kiloniella majae TaxID=1938558 RepID=UPI001302CD34|nr:VOC family protein [Kiloniella majae]
MKLGFVVIYVEDVQEVLNFYQQAFDLKVRMEYKEHDSLLYAELETEGAILGIASHIMGKDSFKGDYQKLTVKGLPFGQTMVFVTEEVHQKWDDAVKAGAVTVLAPHGKPWGQTVAYLRDTAGTLIEICTPMNG